MAHITICHRPEGNSNFIPTYQSENSLNASYSYVSDDFFGFMGDQEGGSETMEDYSLDVGVGRLPAKKEEEAMGCTRKISQLQYRGNKGWTGGIISCSWVMMKMAIFI